MKTLLFFLILIGAALLGCAPTVWFHPPSGATEGAQRFATDAQRCQYDVNLAQAGGRPAQGFEQIILKGAARQGLLTQCMEIKGWRKQKGNA